MKVELKRANNAFHFIGKGNSEHEVHVDASEAIGGEGKGVRPMELLLISIGGCASIDIGLILQKQRQQLDDYLIELVGERRTEDPKTFRTIELKVKVWGDISPEKLEKAIELTVKKYCSVILCLNPEIQIKTSIEIKNN